MYKYHYSILFHSLDGKGAVITRELLDGLKNEEQALRKLRIVLHCYVSRKNFIEENNFYFYFFNIFFNFSMAVKRNAKSKRSNTLHPPHAF